MQRAITDAGSPKRRRNMIASSLCRGIHTGQEFNAQHLRIAAKPDRLATTQAAIDHHHGLVPLEDPLIKSPAKEARHEDRPYHGHPDRPSVRVSTQHEMDAIRYRPVEVVRRVAQA